MKVILVICVLTIACVSYGLEVKKVPEELKKEYEQISEEEKIEEGSLNEKVPLQENYLSKLNSNDTLLAKLDRGFAEQEGTKLGIIVVPDLPENNIDLEYQSQNIVEINENITSEGLINDNENDDEILTTVASLEEETETSAFVEDRYDKYLNSDLTDILETPTELPTTVNPRAKPSTEVNKPLEVSHTAVAHKNFTSENTFPSVDIEIVKRVYTQDLGNKVKRFSVQEPGLKKFERRTFNSWNLLDFGEEKHGSIVKITKEIPYLVPYPIEKRVPFPVKVEVDRPIPVEVPKPYPVTFEKNVFFPVREYVRAPYPVFKKMPYFIQILVDKPIPFHIPRPYPVYLEKKVPYPVEKQIPFPINIPIDRPTPVHIPFVKNVYYPIEKKVRYPVPISVEKAVAVPVEKPYPVYIEKQLHTPVEEHFPYPILEEEKKIENEISQNTNTQKENFVVKSFSDKHFSYPIHVEENKIKSEINQNYNLQKENFAVESYHDHKTEHIGTYVSPASVFGVNDGGFVPLSLSTNNGYDHTPFQKKEDNEPQESKKEERLQEIMTTQLPLGKEMKEEGNTSKEYHDFGKKI